MLTVGSMFAGYRMEGVLGSGLVGVVYRVKDPVLPRRDALKAISSELSSDPDVRAAFLSKADSAAQLDHPNIVPIYARGYTDGQLWVAMELVDGVDADVAVRAGGMTPERAVTIVGQVAEALDYAHHRGVVHGDVKPSNILLSRSDNEERVLLGDFGLARALHHTAATRTGSAMADLAYAAPEVIRGQAIDGRADLYSLGCTLYRLLTGSTPYSSPHGIVSLPTTHPDQAAPRVTDVAPDLRVAFNAVIARALAKDPQERFPTGRALAEAAASALSGEDNQTAPWVTMPRMPPSPPSSQGAGPPSHPFAATAGPATGGAPRWPHDHQTRNAWPPAAQPTQWAGAGIIGSPPGPWMFPPGTFVPPPTGRRRGPIITAIVAAVVIAAAVTTVLVVTSAQSTHSASSSSTTSSPQKIVTPSHLQDLLLSLDQISAIMKAPLKSDQTYMKMTSASSLLTEKECTSSFSPTDQSVYASSGYIAVRSEDLSNAVKAPAAFGPGDITLTQGAIAFSSADYARKFFDTLLGQWRACSNRSVTVTFPGAPAIRVRFGDVTTTPSGAMIQLQSWEGLSGFGCARGLALRSNVIIDNNACQNGAPADATTDITDQTAAKVPQ
jgi:serine/threonine protein kinase